jgi:uncharacterized cupredoxin-like copper-binding protein
MTRTTVIIGVVVAVVAVVGVRVFFLLPRGPAGREFNLRAAEFGFDGFQGGPDLRVKVGETVRIRVTNAGGLPHEFMVVTDKDIAVQMMHEAIAELQDQGLTGEALLEAYEGEHEGMMEQLMPIMGARAEMEPGMMQTIEFRAERAGTFWYVCLEGDGTLPLAHADNGMFGRLIVES